MNRGCTNSTDPTCRTRTRVFLAVVLLGCGAWVPRAHAHLGPPFPIFNDQSVPGYTVSILANPDAGGQAVVDVILEPDRSPTRVAVDTVDVSIQPVSRRTPPLTYRAANESRGDTLRFVAQPQFDAVELWTMGIDIRFKDGSHARFATKVETTPPGIGPWGLLLFLVPIVLFGALFAAVVIRRRRLRSGAVGARRRATVSRRSTATARSERKEGGA